MPTDQYAVTWQGPRDWKPVTISIDRADQCELLRLVLMALAESSEVTVRLAREGDDCSCEAEPMAGRR